MCKYCRIANGEPEPVVINDADTKPREGADTWNGIDAPNGWAGPLPPERRVIAVDTASEATVEERPAPPPMLRGKPEPEFTAANAAKFKLGEAPTARAELLDEAKALVTGDRNHQYGPPHQDFQKTADVLSALGWSVNGRPVQAHHVAVAMIAVKLARLTWSPGKRDSWTDIAGYAACGHEAHELTREEDEGATP